MHCSCKHQLTQNMFVCFGIKVCFETFVFMLITEFRVSLSRIGILSLIEMPELCNICLKTNQLICAEGLFWELCYQHENKGFKTYLGSGLVVKIRQISFESGRKLLVLKKLLFFSKCSSCLHKT